MNWWREYFFPAISLVLFSMAMTYIVYCLSVIGQR
jgi:hypothetical protein